MNTPRALTTLAVLALTPATLAQTAGRTQSCSAIIDAPVEAVWAAFTTEAGIEAWMVPVTSIDLRIGGEWRTSYNPASTLHDDDTIVHTILAYEPFRMIALKTTPPASATQLFGDADFSKLWGVWRFEPLDAGSTRVTITGLGYGQGETWDRVYNFFQRNNPIVLQELATHLAPASASAPRETNALTQDSQRVMQLLHRWVGGEWIHEGHPTGSTEVFRVRNVITPGPDAFSLLCQGWLGSAAGMAPHSLAIIRRSLDGGVQFENVSEAGDIARGRITLLDQDSITWDWNVSELNGHSARFAITMDFPDANPDTYHFDLARLTTDEQGHETRQSLVVADFTRVDHAPDAFLRMAPPPTADDNR